VLVLDDWMTEAEAAAAVKKSVRTLRVWRKRGLGPPYAFFGRTVRYRKPAFIEYFRAVEINPVRTRRGRNVVPRHDDGNRAA
jgi:helix-turn-helix protein